MAASTREIIDARVADWRADAWTKAMRSDFRVADGDLLVKSEFEMGKIGIFCNQLSDKVDNQKC